MDGLLVGVCGTDVEIAVNGYGWVPPGADKLVLFHESLGRVTAAPADSGFATGDLVVGVVRRPDPVPCGACAAGHWDFCLNGSTPSAASRNGTATDRRGGRWSRPSPSGWTRASPTSAC